VVKQMVLQGSKCRYCSTGNVHS